jgi:DNA-binding transcriptional MerR regulator
MDGDARGPLLSIGEVVAELRRSFPDVSHSSLRFLEREGLIAAARTPGGHRLYAPSDLERVRRIKTWQAQRLSLDEIRQRLAQLDHLEAPTALAERFLELALGSDPTGAYRIVLRADELGMPLARLFGDVLQPALDEVGRRWAAGRLLVAQEKGVSELARDLIAELSLRHAHPEPPGPVVVAACVEGELHELGLRMVCGLLRARGWVVHLLGADVAPRFLLEAVQLHAPVAVLLSAKLPPRLPAVEAAIAELTVNLDLDHCPMIVVGGRVAADHEEPLRSMGAIPVVGDRPDEAAAAVIGVLPPAGSGARPVVG